MVDEADTVTCGVKLELTVIVSVFEPTVDEPVQLLVVVSWQLTTSLLFNEDVVNEGELVPALIPFTCH